MKKIRLPASHRKEKKIGFKERKRGRTNLFIKGRKERRWTLA